MKHFDCIYTIPFFHPSSNFFLDLTCLCLCIFPGTAISGMIAFFLTRREMSLMNRTSILCINCFVGLLQLSTIVFLLIGWIWSIVWGCAFVGLSGKLLTKCLNM